MQQSRASNQGGYRIKKQRNNFLGDPNSKDQEDYFKMSIHSSTNKSPGKGSGNKKRNNSLANRHNDSEKFSYRSKNSNVTKGNLSSSSLSGSNRKKNEDPGQIKEFTNVKQLLMIKAYDKKLFRKVTGSNEANKNFLRLGDVRNDPFRKETFKVMIQNFKQITVRIRKGYEKVLSKILFQNTNTSAIVTLANVQPLLEKVRQQADLMHYKVKECLQTHDSRQFRSLLIKFQTFLTASEEIEEIIMIVSESKNRIDDLFKNLQRDKHIDEKVNLERRKGLKKVRNAVRDYGDDCVQAKILDKVQMAINQMADKNLEAYSKINGARGLMMRIKQCLKQNKDFYSLEDIVRLNKIFKEVLTEAESYERFTQKFMEEGDILNDDLRQCIIRYRQEVEVNKTAVYSMELKFVSNIIQTTIQTLEANYSVCSAVDSSLCQDYQKITNLLESVCECISDENVKVNIKAMLRDTGHQFKSVEKLVKKLQRIPKTITIDTEEGLQSLMKAQNLIDDYKNNVRQIMDREDRAHRQITKKRVHRQNIAETDLEQNSISEMIRISKMLNNDERKQRISKCKAFKNVRQNISILQLAAQLGDAKFYTQFKNIHSEIEELCHNNQLNSLIQQITTQSNIYDLSPLFVDLHHIASSVNENNLLKSMENLKSKGFSRLKQVSMVQCFVQRVYALVIIKGLDKKTVKRIDDNRLIQFPQNQHDVESLKRDVKYLKTVSGMMPEVLVKQKMTLAYIAMEQLIEGIKITEDLKWNKDSLYYVQSTLVFKIVSEAFERVFSFKQSVQLDELVKKLKIISQNLDKMSKKEKNSGYNTSRTQKVLQIVKKYQLINSKMMQNVHRIEKMEAFEGYSQLVFCCCQYLKLTLQSFHATLNKTNHVLWLCQEPKQNSKSQFGSSIGLTQLKPGQITKTYNEKCGIKARKQVPKPKPQPKQKQKPKQKKAKEDDEMGEQIEDNQQIGEVEDGIGDEIQDEQMQEDMEQQMEEDMDEMEEEMQDEIPNEEQMDQEMIIEADENIIDDFESESVVKKNNNRPSAAKNKDYTLNTSNKPETTLNNSNPAKNSIQSPQKKQEGEVIVIREKKAIIVLQVFKYIETLEDLAQLLKKINNLRLNFWQAVDLKIIEAYFNKQGKTQIEKLLIQQLEKFCKTQFPAEFLPSIKDSQTHKNILKQIDELSLLKFAVLCELLAFAGKNYGCLMGVNKELLRLSIQANEKWQPSDCVQAFIKKQLALAQIKEENFEKIDYIEQLIKTKKGREIKYEFGDRNMLLKGEQLKEKVKEYEKTIKQYQDYSKFPDSVNLQNLILTMWFNCIKQEDQLVEINIPQKFHEDFKRLSLMENFTHGIYYIKNLRDDAKKIMEGMDKHEKKLSKIFKNLTKETLLESIAQLIKIYSCQQAKVILFEEHPVMYFQSSGEPEPKYKIIKQILALEAGQGNKINSEQMRNKIKKSPEQYAEFSFEINRMLSLLEIECHIWPSPTALHVVQNRDEIVKIIINYISNGLVKDPYEELQNLQEINNCLKVINKENLIFQYAIKQDKRIMDPELNAQFYKQFVKVIDEHSKRIKTKIQVSDTVFENLFGFQDTQDSVTTQVFDYTQTISLILKEKLFAQKWETIFNSHVPTQNKIQELKKKIDSEVRLLLAIVQDPIEIDPAQPEKSLDEMNKKNDLVVKWYKEHRSKQKNTLLGIEICSCANSCDKQYTLYVGQTKNRLEDYLKKLSASSLFADYMKKHEKKSTKSEWKQSSTVHLGKATKQICKTLVETDLEAFRQFIHQYNLVHIIRRETSHKNLADIYQKLVKLNSKKLDVAKMLSEVVVKIKQNATLHKLLNSIIHENCGVELAQLIKNNEEEKSRLSEIGVGKTEYTTFGNWVVHIAGKIYKLPFYILVDLENKNDVVCIMTGKTDDQVKKQLQNLQLPTEFTLIEEKNTYKKIHLNQQYFTIQLDGKQLTKQDLFDLRQQNFGIKEVQREDNHKETWLLGVYRKSNIDNEQDDYQLLMTTLSQNLIEESKKVQVNINQFEIKAEIELRILEISYIEGGNINSNNIIREIKSELHKGVSLNHDIVATALSRFLKTQITKIKNKKKSELQQKLLKEQRQRELEQERIRAAEKVKEEQALRKKKQEQAMFIMQHPDETSVAQHETNVYLDKLYDQLLSKKVYRASKDKLGNTKENKEPLEKPKSSKNIEIKEETEKAIQKVELSLEEDAKRQFHKIAENYLNCIVQFICLRDKVLEQVLQKAKSTDAINAGDVVDEIKYMENLMEEISTLHGYEPGLRAKITQILRTLSKQKIQVLTSIYMMPS